MQKNRAYNAHPELGVGRLLVLRRASWSLPKDEQVFDTTLFLFYRILRVGTKTNVFAPVLASLKYDQFFNAAGIGQMELTSLG